HNADLMREVPRYGRRPGRLTNCCRFYSDRLPRGSTSSTTCLRHDPEPRESASLHLRHPDALPPALAVRSCSDEAIRIVVPQRPHPEGWSPELLDRAVLVDQHRAAGKKSFSLVTNSWQQLVLVRALKLRIAPPDRPSSRSRSEPAECI